MLPQNNYYMTDKKCPDCHSIMVETLRETEVVNGIARRIIEYKCTNPECGTTQIDNYQI